MNDCHYIMLSLAIFRIGKLKYISFFPSPRNDRTKGCPFPSCARYGRAFSRAHDLKRHIARHTMRKEKLQQTDQQKVDIENTASDATLRGALLRGTEDKGGYPCPRCKKRYNDEDKLKAHLASHGKVRLLIFKFLHMRLLISENISVEQSLYNFTRN